METGFATAFVCHHGLDASRRGHRRLPPHGILVTMHTVWAFAPDQQRRPADLGDAPRSVVVSGGLAPWKIRRLKAFIEEHLSDSIRIHDLSDLVGLSVPQFSRAFVQSFGAPPHAYLIQRRLDRARQLMLAGDIALCEVAVSCGFSDQAHFCKVFRRKTGRTPAAWRRERACRDLGRCPEVAGS